MWNWKVCSNLFKFEQNIACHGSDSKDLMCLQNKEKRIRISTTNTQNDCFEEYEVEMDNSLHHHWHHAPTFESIGRSPSSQRTYKESASLSPAFEGLWLRRWIIISKMDPRTTLLKRADSFEDGLNCGRIRFEKELNRIYFTAQHNWCFTALINEVNYSTFYSPWMNFYTNIISLGYLELFDSFRGGPIWRHLDQARSEQTGILMLSPQIHNDSLRPITGWPGVLFDGDAMKHSVSNSTLVGPCVPLRSSSVFLKTFVA